MTTKKPTPTHKISQSVKCFGFSTAQSKRPLWFTVWDKAGVQGHANTIELINVTFELDRAAQAKSRGVKLDGSPSATTLKKREKTGNPSVFDTRKAPFLFVCGTVVDFDSGAKPDGGAVQLRPKIDRSINGEDAHFYKLDGAPVRGCNSILLTTFGIWAWGVF